MKIMKYYFLLFFNFCLSNLFAQIDSKIVNIPTENYSYLPLKYAFEEGENYYFQTLRLSKIMRIEQLKVNRTGIVAYNKDLKEIKNFELKGSYDGENVLEVFFSKGKIYLIGVAELKKEKLVQLYIYDNNGTLIEKKLILTTEKDNSIEFISSTDSSKVAVVAEIDKNDKKENAKIQACILDKTGAILWNEIMDLKVNSEKSTIAKVALANNGDLYTILRSFPVTNKFNFSLSIFNASKAVTIRLQPQEYIGNLGMFETNGGFYLTGFNLNRKRDVYETKFLVKIDLFAESINIPNLPFTSDILQPLISNKFFKEKVGWENLEFQHGWQNKQGQTIIVFEKTIFTSMNSGNESMNMRSVTFNNVDYKEYYLFTYNKDGNLKSINVCPKELRKTAEVFFIPKASFVYDDELYVVYNEIDKNVNIKQFSEFKAYGKTLPILRKFGSDGSIKDIVLNNKSGQYVMPQSLHLGEDGKLIFVSCDGNIYRGKDINIGIIGLKK